MSTGFKADDLSESTIESDANVCLKGPAIRVRPQLDILSPDDLPDFYTRMLRVTRDNLAEPRQQILPGVH